MTKVHLHSEQFDGWFHAECGSIDRKGPTEDIVEEDEFETTPYIKRCRKCSAYWWPKGGEPRNG